MDADLRWGSFVRRAGFERHSKPLWDLEIAQKLKKSAKLVLLVVNKDLVTQVK